MIEGVMPGNNFTISIKTDYNGSDITGWQFTLSYNPNILHGVKVTNGDLISNATHPDAQFIAGTFNNTEGKLSLTGAFFFTSEPASTTSGPGTLVNVTFEVVGIGNSSMTLGPLTRLIGYTEDGYGDRYVIIDGETMPDQLGHGYFNNFLLGDADRNGLVELPDFYIWVKNFGNTPEQCPPGVHPGFDNNGIIELEDFYVWRENFGATVPPQP